MAIKDIEDSNSILVGTDKGIIDLYRVKKKKKKVENNNYALTIYYKIVLLVDYCLKKKK